MKTLFLGSGFTGKYFRYLYPYSLHSSRKKENILSYGGSGVLFNANEPASWKNIRDLTIDGIVISFPLDRCNFPDGLWDMLSGLSSRIIVIGTTSGFAKDLLRVSDDSPIDTENSRSLAEEAFRKKGASVIHSAGIYGQERNPLGWIRKGLIKNRAAKVNLVHGEDLARACSFLLENFSESQRFVISDDHPYTWEEIIRFAVKKQYISDPRDIPSDPAQGLKVVAPVRLFNMGFMLKHPDLFEELQRLEEQGPGQIPQVH